MFHVLYPISYMHMHSMETVPWHIQYSDNFQWQSTGVVSYSLTCCTVAQYCYIISPSYPGAILSHILSVLSSVFLQHGTAIHSPQYFSVAQPCNILSDTNFCRSTVICILTGLSVAQYCDILLTTSSSLRDMEVSIWTKKVWGLATEETYTSTNSRPNGQEHTWSVCSEGPVTKYRSVSEVV